MTHQREGRQNNITELWITHKHERRLAYNIGMPIQGWSGVFPLEYFSNAWFAVKLCFKHRLYIFFYIFLKPLFSEITHKFSYFESFIHLINTF